MGQGEAKIQILLCCEPSAGASLRLQSQHWSENILQEKKTDAGLLSKFPECSRNLFQSLNIMPAQGFATPPKQTLPSLEEKSSKPTQRRNTRIFLSLKEQQLVF
jgi:hypothetical protein